MKIPNIAGEDLLAVYEHLADRWFVTSWFVICAAAGLLNGYFVLGGHLQAVRVADALLLILTCGPADVLGWKKFVGRTLRAPILILGVLFTLLLDTLFGVALLYLALSGPALIGAEIKIAVAYTLIGAWTMGNASFAVLMCYAATSARGMRFLYRNVYALPVKKDTGEAGPH